VGCSGVGRSGVGRSTASTAVRKGILDGAVVAIVGCVGVRDSIPSRSSYLTESLGCVPKHHTTKGGELGTRSRCDTAKRVDVDIARASGGRGRRGTDIDLDILVR
jgi:hypothetical protein